MVQRPSIREQLESSREELLDLSLRNRLLNFRPLKTRGVQVVDELPDQLHRTLVLEGRTMSFLPREKAEDEPGSDLDLPQPELEPESGLVAERHTDRFLQTVHSSHRLQYRLLNTFYAARTAIEELGVNLLYLALGMLEWYEDENSEILRRAPLILIPVRITRSDVQHRFRLEYTGEEIRTNLSLKLKLRRDFGVELPSVSEDEQSEIDVVRYHNKVREAVARMDRWRIDGTGIFLGFFTFSRLVMYEDLDTEAWPNEKKPQSHPLIESLLGEGFKETEPLLTDEDDLDRQLEPEQLHHVIEADSSQALALTDALGGRNLAIQGPPGTGKSQTITNLVAEAVAAQKRVLFVAEKRAALEVVKRNLDATGLGDACLEIHSHKSTKKAVLEDLQRTLRLGVPQQQDAPGHFRQLVRARDRLNRYSRAVNTPIGESGVTPYRAYGELLRLGQRLDLDSPELPRVASARVRSWPSEAYEERVARVRELEALIAAAGRPCDHAFWGSGRRVYLPERDRPRILAAAKASRAALGDLRQAGSLLASHLGTDPPATMCDAELLSRTARTASEAPDLDGIEVKDRTWLEHSSDIREVLETGTRIARCHQRFDGVLVPTAWCQDVKETRATLAAVGPRWWRFLAPRFWRARRALVGLLTANLPNSSSERLAILDAILEVQGLTPLLLRRQGKMQVLFGKRWHAQDSDWDALRTAADYLEFVHREIEAGSLSAGVLEYLATAESPAAAAKPAAELDERMSKFRLNSREASQAVDLDLAVRFPGQSLADVPFGELTPLFECWQAEVDSLQEIVKFNLTTEMLDPSRLPWKKEMA